MKKYLAGLLMLGAVAHGEMIGGNADIATSVGLSYRETMLGGTATTYEGFMLIREVKGATKDVEQVGAIDFRVPVSDWFTLEGSFGGVCRYRTVNDKKVESLNGTTFSVSMRFYLGR